jgi:transcriptional regulator with XRE-family HTH domain
MAPLDVLGTNVLRARKALRLTQEDVSGRSGVHVTEVSRIERGLRDPRVTTVLRLADALNVSPATLLDGVQTARKRRR